MTALKQRSKRSALVLFTEREAPGQRFQSNSFYNTLENNENTTEEIRITPCSANQYLS
jgi:hypothetical protein